MINLIVLAADRDDVRAHVAMLDRELDINLIDVLNDDETLWKLRPDRADPQTLDTLWAVRGWRNRLHVTDRARVTTQQINALHLLHARFGLEDPTGLLGAVTATYYRHEGDAGRSFNVGKKAGVLMNVPKQQRRSGWRTSSKP